MDIDGPEFISQVNEQIASLRSLDRKDIVDVTMFDIAHDYVKTTHDLHLFNQSLSISDINHFAQIAIVDTNFLISNLKSLQTLLNLAEENIGSLLILIPWVVIRELDSLKTCNRKEEVAILSRKAMKFIESQLRSQVKSIRGQRLHETLDQSNMQNDKLKGDDRILDCCMYFQLTTHKPIVLLSNDRNLCIKVMVHGIESISTETKDRMNAFFKKMGASQRQITEPEKHPVEESYDMDIDDDNNYTQYQDHSMAIDSVPHTHKSSSSGSKWAHETLIAPRRPTPPPLPNLAPPAYASDRSTWASIHAPRRKYN
ncbi:hypothetical protein BCV71DRAFT_268216 [Rhizopus microsporus]|nr:hypothetical protein BCV71DRAFT_268216 [Rhizopus microsporus]